MGQSQSMPTAAANGAQPKDGRELSQPPAGCPMHQQQAAEPLPPSAGKCPVDHDQQTSAHAPWGQVNPENNMPSLAQAPAQGQRLALPLERTISSIPRAASSSEDSTPPPTCPVAHSSSKKDASSDTTQSTGKWEYPSPQQFYNALVRKGWETPEESVEMMVNIHNWLNEEAWNQVRTWEEKHVGGDRSMLASFSGRPQDISPKARYHMFMGKLFPNTYAKTTRAIDANVIDYYSLPDDDGGNPVFSLDVRPAIDDFSSLRERLSFWYESKRAGWQSNTGNVPGVRAQEGRE
ncbi:holocytochrome c synthase [Microbotryomycetes sp. JL221]|nr:holocytochrome c synthase [Microbotryomycetes sp. JL221]